MTESRAMTTWPELMAATSLAADTAMSLPLETGLAICLVSVQLARALGLDDHEVHRTYHLALLEHVGCTAANDTVSAVVGDEMLMREHSSVLDFTDGREMFGFMLAHVRRANPVLARPMALARAVAGGRKVVDTAVDVCEAGQMLAARLGYAEEHLADLAQVYEHWDGSGVPNGVAGDDLSMPVQIVRVATLAVSADRLMGRDAALALVSSRSGRMLSPAVTEALLGAQGRVLAPLNAAGSLWDAVMAAEPLASTPPSDNDVDRALAALGDLADLKSPYHIGHSPGVAALAAGAARRYGLADADVRLLRRAGYVHDIGRIAVSAGVWGSSRPLRPDELEKVRMHPHHTHQVLDRSPFLRTLDAVACAHHERLDGSGYHRRLRGPMLPVTARILAAADTHQTKSEARPYREALEPDDVAAFLRNEVAAGRLDGAAVDAVLEAAGLPREDARTARRLTGREIEILGLVSRGSTMREIARALSISPKTVDGHLQRIYPKIGVSTRSGATLYAIEHGLLSTGAATNGEISP